MRYKAKEYVDLALKELLEMVEGVRKEQLKLRFLKRQGKLKDSSAYLRNRRLIATLLTLIREKKSKIK
jgi:ribosomal protein L29